MRVCCRGLRVSHKPRHTYSGVYKNDTPAGLKTPPTIERTNLLSLKILIYFTMNYKWLCSQFALKRSYVYYFPQLTSRILLKHFLLIFTLGTCLVFVAKAASQMPSLAEQVFQKHQTTLLSEDVQAVLPEALVEFKKQENQELLTTALIEAVLENPDLLKRIVPEISDEFITLLKQEDSDIRILFSDPDVQTLLQTPESIDELVHLLEAAKSSLAIRIFERYERLFQRADIRESLPDVLTTLKQPDTQALLRPAMIKVIAENPDLLKVIVPEIEDKFITLLKEDPEVNTFINDPDLHVLLQNPAEIDELSALLDIGTEPIVSIVPASFESPDVGDQFAIAVVIDNAHNVRGYHLPVQFDPEALRYVSWQQGTYLSGDVFAAPATIASDQISFVVTAPMTAESTHGILLTITFEVVATKASMLSLNDAILVSGEGVALPVRTEESEIVEPMPVETEDGEIVESTPAETEESGIVEPMPAETEESGIVEPMPAETEESGIVEPMPVETEESEAVEPIPAETEESEVVEPTPAETEESEVVEPTPAETEESEIVEPTPAETEESEIVERLTPAWDVNEDGFVNILDLVLVRSNFGQEGPTPTDVNGDNVVNILDLTLVANHLGEY